MVLLIGILGIGMHTGGSLQKVLAIKHYILHVIGHKTSLKVKGVQPHIKKS